MKKRKFEIFFDISTFFYIGPQKNPEKIPFPPA